MVARIDRDGNIVRDLETGPLIGSIEEVSSPSLISFLPDSLKAAGVTRRVLVLQWIVFVISCFVPTVGYVEPSSLALLRIGSDSRSFLQCAACGYVLEIRRLLFPIFMHSGVAHILMNTLFQIYTCAEFEALLGSKSFIVQYIGAGLFGNLCYAMYGESGVGASGACYGLLGAGAMRLYISWPSMEPVIRENAKSVMLRQAAILVFLELVAWNSVAHGAHIGGLISGACIYAVLTGSSSTSPREISLVWYCKAGLSAIAFVALSFIIYPVTMNFRAICVECESLMSIYR